MKTIKFILYFNSLFYLILSLFSYVIIFKGINVTFQGREISEQSILIASILFLVVFLINFIFSFCFSSTLKKFFIKEKEVSSLIKILEEKRNQQDLLIEKLSKDNESSIEQE